MKNAQYAKRANVHLPLSWRIYISLFAPDYSACYQLRAYTYYMYIVAEQKTARNVFMVCQAS